MTAIWSLNEIEALAKKAARGAGYDWGLAEEAGQAVRWLLARGLPGADALLFICEAKDTGDFEQCPLRFGCALSDGYMSVDGIEPCEVTAPLLIVPFLSWTSRRVKTPLSVAWPDAQFGVSPKGKLRWSGAHLCPKQADITLSKLAITDVDAVALRHRAEVDCETFMSLSAFAARTYAPSTEESRASGAGAGLTDND